MQVLQDDEESKSRSSKENTPFFMFHYGQATPNGENSTRLSAEFGDNFFLIKKGGESKDEMAFEPVQNLSV